MPRTLTDKEILELLTVGLTWLRREHSNNVTGWSGHSIIKVMMLCGALSEQQYRLLERKPPQNLRNLLTGRAYLHYPSHARGAAGHIKPEKLKGKLFIVRVAGTRGVYFADRILVPPCYSVLPTAEGQRLGDRVAGNYPVAPDRFYSKWDAYSRQVNGMYAADKNEVYGRGGRRRY